MKKSFNYLAFTIVALPYWLRSRSPVPCSLSVLTQKHRFLADVLVGGPVVRWFLAPVRVGFDVSELVVVRPNVYRAISLILWPDLEDPITDRAMEAGVS